MKYCSLNLSTLVGMQAGFLIRWLKIFGDLISFIIIEDLHKFNDPCLMPIDPWNFSLIETVYFIFLLYIYFLTLVFNIYRFSSSIKAIMSISHYV